VNLKQNKNQKIPTKRRRKEKGERRKEKGEGEGEGFDVNWDSNLLKLQTKN